MEELNKVLSELGISKVRLAKYLGVSRQMLYNYLAFEDISKWPKEKSTKLLNLLEIDNIDNIKDVKIDADYIMSVENRLNEGVKNTNMRENIDGIKGFNKKEQELLTDIINLLKYRIQDNPKNITAFNYLYNFLKSMDTHEELKYSLGYINKVLGYISPNEFNFNKEKQYIFESIIYSAMKIYQSGNASKTKLTKIHEEFENDIMKQKEEKLSRTLELNAIKIQALKELGYTKINEDNYKELMDKIAEIDSRRV